MLLYMNQAVTERLMLFNFMERVSFVLTCIGFLAAGIIFWKRKIYKSIDYLTGIKMKRNVEKAKKYFHRGIYIMAFIFGIIGIFGVKELCAMEQYEDIEKEVKIAEKEQEVSIRAEKYFNEDEQYPEILFSNKNSAILFRIRKKDNSEATGKGKITVYREDEEGNTSCDRIPWGDTADSFEREYIEKVIRLEAKEGEESRYKILLERDGEGTGKLVLKEGEKYGQFSQEYFESKTLIIDKNPPIVDNQIAVEPIKYQGENEGICHYNEGVKASLCVEEKFFCNDRVELYAVPMDQTAIFSAENSENVTEKGYIEIQGWKLAKSGKHTYRLTFSFREQGRWKLKFSCQDAAMNLCIIKDDKKVHEIYSQEFIIDRYAPWMSVDLDDFTRISNYRSDPSRVNKKINRNIKNINSSECEIFAKETTAAVITIREDYFDSEKVEMTAWRENYQNGEKENVTMEFFSGKNRWHKNNNGEYVYRFLFEKEGHYQFKIKYKDYAGNEVTADKGDETAACLEKGIYTSPYCTVDKTVPVINEILFEKEPIRRIDGTSYFDKAVQVKIKVIEENFNQEDFNFKDRITVVTGNDRIKQQKKYSVKWDCYYEGGKRINEASFIIDDAAEHIFFLSTADGAGYHSEIKKEKCVYDSTKPEITYVSDINQKGDVLFYEGETSRKKNRRKCRFIKYNNYRYFSRNGFLIKITVHDDVSGVEKIHYYFTDDTGRRIENSIGTKRAKRCSLSEYTAWIKVSSYNFKGKIHIYAEDYCGQRSREVISKGMVAETLQKHQDMSKLHIEMPEAVYLNEEKGIRYYNSDFIVRAQAKDKYSGIKKLKLWEKAGEEAEVDGRENKDEIYKATVGLRFKAEDYKDSSPDNPMTIKAYLEDNAGNVSQKIYSDYKVVLDNVPPEITVKYNTYECMNQKYYNKTRVADIEVKDQNFNPSAVAWMISGSNERYHIGEWERAGKVYRCRIVFGEDGEDYKIKLKAEDYAGNQTVWDEDQAFTVDKISPKIGMAVQEKGRPGTNYYNTALTVNFEINEKNFIDKDVNIRILRKQGKKTEKIAFKQQFYTAKNRHRLSVGLGGEGEYSIQFQYTDAAGNKGNEVTPLKFVIDRTPPIMKISGVKNGMAYEGKIAPTLTCMDTNLDKKNCYARIYRLDGGRLRKTLAPVLKKERKNVINIAWRNFPKTEWADGIYLMKVKVSDKAGNSTTCGKGITFYVNRFGADFYMGKSMEQLLRKKYLRSEEDIIIEEKSVLPTDTKIILWKDNQERRELKEYLIIDKERQEKGKKGWQDRTYRIKKENFTEEGRYRIVFQTSGYIRQREEKIVLKETTNELRGKPIYFVVDKTPPAVHVGGLEAEVYNESVHKIRVTAMDNFQLDYFEVRIHYKDGRKADQSLILHEEDFDKMHSAEIELEAYNGWQTIRYIAKDAAGNITDSGVEDSSITCLISTDKLVRIWYHSPWMIAVVLGGGSIPLIGVLLWIRKRKGVLTQK